MKPTVAVDLDGTLAHYEKFTTVTDIGQPIPGAQTFCQQLMGLGCSVVVFTTRTNSTFQGRDEAAQATAAVKEWLRNNAFPADVKVYTGYGKPLAVAYIDDRGVTCAPQTIPGAYGTALAAVKPLIEDAKKKDG